MATLQQALEAVSSGKVDFFQHDHQSTHRIAILRSWLSIALEQGYDLESQIFGKQTLDIGTGQGDMIAAFAAVLKAQGGADSKVIGVDPADLDYGSPMTLGQAQSLLSNGPVGEFLRFEQSTAPDVVASQPVGTYSIAYFAHSLYYFPSSATLVQNFKALLDGGLQTLLLAEWSLSVSRPLALPHLLAVLLQSTDPLPQGNIRTVLSPAAYVEAALEAGWELVGSKTFTPSTELEDGKWETRIARGIQKRKVQVTEERSLESVHLENIRAHADALESSVLSAAEAKEDVSTRVECMDVWTALFKPKTLISKH